MTPNPSSSPALTQKIRKKLIDSFVNLLFGIQNDDKMFARTVRLQSTGSPTSTSPLPSTLKMDDLLHEVRVELPRRSLIKESSYPTRWSLLVSPTVLLLLLLAAGSGECGNAYDRLWARLVAWIPLGSHRPNNFWPVWFRRLTHEVA
jgi:hypothetical protein